MTSVDAAALFLSAWTLLTIWMAEGNPGRAWVSGAINQTGWTLWAIWSGNVGLIPLEVTLGCVYLRNIWKRRATNG